ncbi:MAG: AraC family transcriptional regulator [Verrucomicrobiota bacterium]|nr:AraC family transcriptional regulator [Verrucomicrobiota bacterium]
MDASTEQNNPADWWPTDILKRRCIKSVVLGGRKTTPPPLSHVVNIPRLELVLSGSYENQLETEGRCQTLILKPGTAFFAPPNCWNLPTWRCPVVILSLLFGHKQLGISLVEGSGKPNLPLLVRKMAQPRLQTGATQLILEAMLALATPGQAQDALPNLAQALIHCVGQPFVQSSLSDALRAHNLIDSISLYIQSNYQHDLSRDSVAAHFNVSPNHLSRLYRQHGAMTFSNYLTHVRIDRAKYLLRAYDLKLEDISTRCGFHDTAYFCRVFKRLVKLTPQGYRSHLPLR